MEKKKLLIIGIVMNCAGTEKSFLSFADCLDYEKYDVTLLLAKKEGLFLPLLPKEIKVMEMDKYADMFTLTGASAAGVIRRDFCKKNPFVYFEILPYFLRMKLHPSSRSFTAMRLWVHMQKKFPDIGEKYDAAVAYWGDKTMFYMIDHVKADKKIAWLHFDYSNPPRDDELYGEYFSKCDSIVTVSDKIDFKLKRKLPYIADRCIMMENIENPRLLREMAKSAETFNDDFDGTRILTVGRISEQKGYDFAVEALARLSADGRNVKWYVLGGGDEKDIANLKELARVSGVADRLVLLGTTVNPYGYMRDCDIYAQPSRHEGKPIAVEEAKIFARPIIVCDYLSANEQLEYGKLGRVVPIGSCGVYTGLTEMLDNPDICREYTERLKQCDFGNTNEIEKFYKMLEK